MYCNDCAKSVQEAVNNFPPDPVVDEACPANLVQPRRFTLEGCGLFLQLLLPLFLDPQLVLQNADLLQRATRHVLQTTIGTPALRSPKGLQVFPHICAANYF